MKSGLAGTMSLMKIGGFLCEVRNGITYGEVLVWEEVS